MATAKINIKNIDFFKFKKIVIDGNRDDYSNCSKEVKALCDSVQTLSFRDEEFDVQSDRSRFEEICTYYHQILQSKRIDPIDMRIKSGWWGDHKTGYSAGKIKPAVLLEVLVAKTKDWAARHGGIQPSVLEKIADKIEGPGLYVFKHKEHQCFQYIGRADNVFAKCAETLKAAFEGIIAEPLAALLVISMTTDWDFYFIPVSSNDSNRVLRILENDLILKHDCIWPHGLNFSLHIDSLLEVSEFRKSCLRHHWPPETDAIEEKEIDLNRLRKQVAAYAACSPDKPFAAPLDQNHRNDTSSQDDADSDKSGAKKQTRPSTANKATSRQTTSMSSAQKQTQSPSKQPGEKLSASSIKTTTTKSSSSPAKHTTSKQVLENRDIDQTADTSPTSDMDAGSNQSDADQTTPAIPTLNRSNTFTYSDSESSSESCEPGKEKTSSSSSTTTKVPKTPTKQSAKQPTSSRLPMTSTQRQ